jgi:tetratricopeptide (TPR) repeat protein
LLVVLVVAPATALAGKKEEARVHIAKATKAHRDGRFNDARVELEAAYALDPQPDLLYAIGQVHAKLGNCSSAIAYYKLFVAVQKDPQVARVIDQAISACKPAPAPAAQALPPALPPQPDASPQRTGTRVPPLEDERPPAPAQKPALRADRAPSPTPGSAPLARRPPAPAAGHAPWYSDKLGDTLVLGGVAATVVGVIEYRGALSDLDAAEDRASAPSLTRYHALVDQARSKHMTSIVLAGAGGSLIVAGILRYVLHDRTEEASTVGVTPAHRGGVLTYGGRF